jgi:hypothetical protein
MGQVQRRITGLYVFRSLRSLQPRFCCRKTFFGCLVPAVAGHVSVRRNVATGTKQPKGHIWAGGTASQPFYARPNVTYSRNVMRHLAKKIV